MPTHLYLAPAAAGKTAWALAYARDASRSLAAAPRVLVPTHLQARAARRRLAESGGAIGVRVLTFDRLYAEVLNAAGEIYVELSDPVQYRLIRAIADGLVGAGALAYHAPLADRPGFIQVLQRLIGELKAAAVHPEAFAAAVAALGGEPRLVELAQVYTAYQARLKAQGWADRAGLGWLAVEALDVRAAGAARDWPLLVVDGFDSFTPGQALLLRCLAGRVGELAITLTGAVEAGRAGPELRRFAKTRAQLEAALGCRAAALPGVDAPALLSAAARSIPRAAAVEMIEAPDRDGEARAALRWLKARMVEGCRPDQVALLARNIAAYRPFIQQTAAEFGLPVRLVDGLPLRENPAVAALLSLLQMALPGPDGGLSLPRRQVVEAWRSPYFDWAAPGAEAGIGPGDADRLDGAARQGRVIGGQAQWLDALARMPSASDPEAEEGPAGAARPDLRGQFERFIARITPPAPAQSYRAYTGWLEDLIGADLPGAADSGDEACSLRVAACARAGDAAAAERDIAALAALKDVLRGLVWAEEALPDGAGVSFPRFVAELGGALDAATYRLPARAGREELLVADVIQARGLPFRAAALLGLAEGEFPATVSEDPFLRDADRRRLRDAHGLPLELSTEAAEAEFFYETAARPAERLLLTRPRLADNGATWQASPYWEEEIRRGAGVKPSQVTGEAAPPPEQAASWPELLESLAVHPAPPALRQWVEEVAAGRLAGVRAGAAAVRARAAVRGGAAAPEFDGGLAGLADACAGQFGPAHIWSASQLEAYRECPFRFFVDRVLGLAPREEPAEGLDARQLGNIYHHIFEALYRAAGGAADLDALLAALPAAAAGVLDAAPEVEGFRATAWWLHSRAEIEANVRRSVEALSSLPGGYAPLAQELGFGGPESLVVRDGSDMFRMRGFIDRVDRGAGGGLRIIDYKTGGPDSFTAKAVSEGKKLQLPLYALAAEQALRLGAVVEGFYWHVQHAEPSKFTLGSFEGGPAAAIEAARQHAWAAVRGARAGEFTPQPPAEGCPEYCPAAGFCWHYRGKRDA